MLSGFISYRVLLVCGAFTWFLGVAQLFFEVGSRLRITGTSEEKGRYDELRSYRIGYFHHMMTVRLCVCGAHLFREIPSSVVI